MSRTFVILFIIVASHTYAAKSIAATNTQRLSITQKYNPVSVSYFVNFSVATNTQPRRKLHIERVGKKVLL